MSLIARLGLRGIKRQLVAFTIGATLIPALSTAWISYAQNRRSLTAKIEQELASAGAQSARALDLWSKERLYELRVFGASYEVSENLERVQRGQAPQRATARARLGEYLRSVQERFTDYDELLVVDPAGTPAATSARSPGAIRLPENWPRRLRGDEALLGDPYRDDDGHTRVTIAVPLTAASGRFLGGLLARANVASIRELLTTFSPSGAGQVTIIDGTGSLISIDSAAIAETIPEDAVRRLRAAQGGVVEYRNQADVPVVASLVDVTQLGWSVIAAIPRDAAFAQVTRLRNMTLLLLSVLLVVVGSLAYGLGALLVRPLDRLTQGAARVAGGDLTVDLPATAGGEIGYLTTVFNDMVARLRDSRQALERLTVTDVLTGVSNRRHLMTALDLELKRSVRHQHPCAVLMLDVDHFKQYNDTHGHLSGDAVLAGMGRLLKETLRTVDHAARYGGEEFAVVLPETSMEAGIRAAERIRARLAQEVFQTDGGQTARITLSIGVAAYPDHGETGQALLGAADAALYQAKKKGRDRVVAAGRSVQPARDAT